MALHAFDHRAAGHLDEIRRVAPAGVDVALEMLANVNLAHNLALLAPFGRVVVIGKLGDTTINPRLTKGKHADIRGMQLLNATPRQLDRIHSTVATDLASGRIAPVIAHRPPPTAHHWPRHPGTRADPHPRGCREDRPDPMGVPPSPTSNMLPHPYTPAP